MVCLVAVPKAHSSGNDDALPSEQLKLIKLAYANAIEQEAVALLSLETKKMIVGILAIPLFGISMSVLGNLCYGQLPKASTLAAGALSFIAGSLSAKESLEGKLLSKEWNVYRQLREKFGPLHTLTTDCGHFLCNPHGCIPITKAESDSHVYLL